VEALQEFVGGREGGGVFRDIEKEKRGASYGYKGKVG